jgi:rare lipoprotein A
VTGASTAVAAQGLKFDAAAEESMRQLLCLIVIAAAAACGGVPSIESEPEPEPSPPPPRVSAPPPASRPSSATGLASYYAASLHGGVTADGTRFDNNALVAAHPSYPFGTVVRVTNVANGRQITVRIVDRGPTAPNRREGVVIDLSRRAAERLGILRAGRARVQLLVIRWGDGP